VKTNAAIAYFSYGRQELQGDFENMTIIWIPAYFLYYWLGLARSAIAKGPWAEGPPRNPRI